MRPAFLLTLLIATPALAHTIPISTSEQLRAAARTAQPGDTLQLAPGTYASGNFLTNLHGTPAAPITIEASDDHNPPLFKGGTEALHLSACTYLTLRHLAFTGQSANGINIDDAGAITPPSPSHHITLDHITVTDTGPGQTMNSIKLSGIDDFTLRHITTERWGGSSVDMVGCHRGLLEDCTFGDPKTPPSKLPDTGPQIKGGSSDITLRHCSFPNTAERAINAGGATGLPYFRPHDAPYEAHNITIEACTFTGSTAAIAFPGCDTATVRYNTIYLPHKWILRILQESTDPRFTPCRNVTLDHNLIVFRTADCPTPINIGPHTAPETFTFSHNFWFCTDAPNNSKPNLPTPDPTAIYGTDPHLTPDHLTPSPNSPAAHYGAAALPTTNPSR